MMVPNHSISFQLAKELSLAPFIFESTSEFTLFVRILFDQSLRPKLGCSFVVDYSIPKHSFNFLHCPKILLETNSIAINPYDPDRRPLD
jgi:hypothetical protein